MSAISASTATKIAKMLHTHTNTRMGSATIPQGIMIPRENRIVMTISIFSLQRKNLAARSPAGLAKQDGGWPAVT